MARIDEVASQPSAPSSSVPPNRAEEYDHPNKGFLKRAHRWATVAGGLYALILILLTIPFFQIHAVYMQFVRWPLFAKFEQPEKYGLAADKTVNLRLNTSDGVGIGAWFVVSDHYYLNTVDRPNVATIGDHIVPTLKEHPTVLFFHGNAANRAIGYRVNHYQAWSRMGANVLVIDYRGFGDSEGVPSEDGIARDARASWNWLVDNGARADDILVVGHSLGTAVAAQLVKQLQDETNTRPKGLFLQAPFSSLRILIDTYYILGLFPLMKPLDLIPGMQTVLKYFLALKYDTEAIIGNIVDTPIFIVHAEDDWDIPYTHSAVLFSAVLDPHLPPEPEVLKPSISYHPSEQEWAENRAKHAERRVKRDALITTQEVDRLGTLQVFPGGVYHLQTKYGGHNPFQLEGVQNLVRDIFQLKP